MTGGGEVLVEALNLAKLRVDGDRRLTVVLPALRLRPGDRLALAGESGSGKSTLLALLSLATFPQRAPAPTQVLSIGGADALAAWEGNDIARLSMLRARTLAFMPQRDGLLEFLTVRQNILCAAELAGRDGPVDFEALEAAVKLEGLLDALPGRLSGGQRQRAAVACTLARRPRVILLDEPTAALDAENARRVMTALCDFAEATGAGVVLATHQLHLLDSYGFTALTARPMGPPEDQYSVFEAAA